MATALSPSASGRGMTRPGLPPSGTAIVHLGLGNFHRAHQAVYTAAALDAESGPWGIVGVAHSSRRVVDPLIAQGGRYSVLTLDPSGATAEVVAVHTDLLVSREQPEELLDHLADEDIRVVTLTVTENGYSYDPRTGALDRSLPAVQADLAGEAPTTAVGQLARGLERRHRAGGAPLSIVSCDNLSDNGRWTRSLVEEFVESMRGEDADDLLAWMDAAVTFPSTMVDRIVPATEDSHRGAALELLGVADEVPVPAEPFHMWVLEDDFAAGRPRWEAAGAIFTDDVEAYELVKLRVLNASNSMLAYLGLLAGKRYIAEALATPGVREVVEHLMRVEMLPTLRVPDGIDIDAYIDETLRRFGNSAVGHRTSQVGSDGSLKLPVRITEPALFHLDRGRPVGAIALLVAAYIRCLASPGAYPATVTGVPSDPRAADLAAIGGRAGSPKDLVRAVFDEAGIFPAPLAERGSFVEHVGELYEALVRGGPAAAAKVAQERHGS